MVRTYTEKGRSPREHRDALMAFASLRNAIGHGRYYNNRPIADPVPEVVDQIEELRDQLCAPPKVLKVLGRVDVVRLAPGDQVRLALRYVGEDGYSQIPVYDDDAYVGPLTTNAIARWLAAHFDESELGVRAGRHRAPVRRGPREGPALLGPSYRRSGSRRTHPHRHEPPLGRCRDHHPKRSGHRETALARGPVRHPAALQCHSTHLVRADGSAPCPEHRSLSPGSRLGLIPQEDGSARDQRRRVTTGHHLPSKPSASWLGPSVLVGATVHAIQDLPTTETRTERPVHGVRARPPGSGPRPGRSAAPHRQAAAPCGAASSTAPPACRPTR